MRTVYLGTVYWCYLCFMKNLIVFSKTILSSADFRIWCAIPPTISHQQKPLKTSSLTSKWTYIPKKLSCVYRIMRSKIIWKGARVVWKETFYYNSLQFISWCYSVSRKLKIKSMWIFDFLPFWDKQHLLSTLGFRNGADLREQISMCLSRSMFRKPPRS